MNCRLSFMRNTYTSNNRESEISLGKGSSKRKSDILLIKWSSMDRDTNIGGREKAKQPASY